MKLRPDQLDAQLGRELSPVYLLCGDEPLQKEEAADAIRRRCRDAGVSGRSVFHVDTAQFDWSQVLAEASSLSLFAERKLIELRINTSGPGKNGSSAIRELLELPGSDNVLLLICGKLDRSAQNGAWYKAIDRGGVIVTSWPITGRDLQEWIRARLASQGIRADRDAVELIAVRVEGNLLAAKQEIERLALQCDGGRIDGSSAARLVADNARYNVFELAEAALVGDGAAALRMLHTLRGEGVAEAVVLWSLARELRNLLALSEARSFEETMRGLRVPPKQRARYTKAIERLRAPQLQRLLRQAARIDRCIKGLESGNAWDELGRLLMALCSTPARRRA